MNKKNLFLISSFIIAISVTLISLTYSFFNIDATSQKEEIKVQTGTLEITFSDGDPSFNKSLEFGTSAEKQFVIENKGTISSYNKINFEELINTYLEGSLTYSLSYRENETEEYFDLFTNKNVPISKEMSTQTLADNLTIPPNTTYYYKLTITLNYLNDVDQTQDLNAILSTRFLLEEDSRDYLNQIILSKANDENVKDYNLGNKGEVFTFTHTETTQTTGWTDEERTDFRYIGNEPKNYIEFNNEIWRIIGVFTVEGENGKKEQRVKIISDTPIGEFPWDAKETKTTNNNWVKSSIQNMLNGNYVEQGDTFDYKWVNINNSQNPIITTSVKGLSKTARDQIALTKWYLAGSPSDKNLGADDYYNKERGTIVNSKNDTNVLSNVGLIYPSDYSYTYAYNIENACYNNGYNCVKRTLSWLSKESSYWTIFATTTAQDRVLFISSSGSLRDGNDVQYGYVDSFNTSYYRKIFPTVYLRNDIQLKSGIGTKEEPYILK